MKEEMKKVVPFILSFGLSLMFLFEHFETTQFVGGYGLFVFIGLIAILICFMNIMLLFTAIVGLLNTLGITKWEFKIGKLSAREVTEIALLCFCSLLALYYVFWLIATIAYHMEFSFMMLLKYLIGIAFYFIYLIYVKKALKENSVLKRKPKKETFEKTLESEQNLDNQPIDAPLDKTQE